MNDQERQRVLRVMDQALTVFDSPARAAAWLARPNRVLRGCVPAVLAAESEQGQADVERELAAASRRVYLWV